MPKGELFINGKDAFVTWGVSMNSTALSALMTPPAVKSYVENDNRMEHGKRVITTNVRKAARDITLTFNITAKNESVFMRNYASFCKELAHGVLEIETIYQDNTAYKCLYQSCSQFSEFRREIGSFVLRLTEPNPDDRIPGAMSSALNEGGEADD